MTPEAIALKRATSEMVRGVGGVEAGASFCRIGKTKLGEYQSVSHDDRFVPIDVVAALEPLARDREGWPHVTRQLCATMGGVFVPLPDAPVAAGGLLAMLARQARESADVSQAICAAITDGKVCNGDRAKIRAEVRQLIEIAVAMDVHLGSIEAEDCA